MSDDIISKSGEVVGQWNGDSVADLQKELQKIKMDLRKQGKKDKVEHNGVPHSDQFPDDLKNFTAYILWAVDKNDKVLVGSGANRTETVESIREFYANDEAKASIDRHNLEE
jgi:hypothetical protein